MGGKGIRRRERNYRAAHGGYDRLPPPPNVSKADALPSKLRKLISFTSSTPQDSDNLSKLKDKRESSVQLEKKSHSKGDQRSIGIKDGGDGGTSQTSEVTDSGGDMLNKSSEKKNRKRKRKQVNDLRFETLENSDRSLKKRERWKKYHEAKKNKHKKAKTEEDLLDFPKHEKVKFGDVVEAPPKLVVPKAFKLAQGASQERKRLQAINEYRNRKGWTSRPGIQLPSMPISPTI